MANVKKKSEFVMETSKNATKIKKEKQYKNVVHIIEFTVLYVGYCKSFMFQNSEVNWNFRRGFFNDS
jgi:hypothetical protein